MLFLSLPLRSWELVLIWIISHTVLGHADSLPVHEGTFIAKQSITRGIDNAIDGLLGMLKGENFGKAVLTIAELDEKVSIGCMP